MGTGIVASSEKYVCAPCGGIITNILRVSKNDYEIWRRTEIYEELSYFVGAILFTTFLGVVFWHLMFLDRPVMYIGNTVSDILFAFIETLFFGILFIILLVSFGLSCLVGPPLISSFRIKRKQKEFLQRINRSDIDVEKVSTRLCVSNMQDGGYLIIAHGQSIENQLRR